MKAKPTLFLLLFLNCHFILSQGYDLVGLIDNKILKIDQNTGQTTLLLEIKNVPDGTDLRDLVYEESKDEFYTIANPTENPYLAKISRSGEFGVLQQLQVEFATIYTVESISLYNDEVYISASLNGGTESNDYYSESLLKINTENKIEFVTEINTDKSFPDIDAMQIYKDKIFIFDGAPPSQNFLSFYELDFNNLATSSSPTEVYSSSYIPIVDFCYINDQLVFVEQKSLYKFENSIQKITDIELSNISEDKIFNGLSKFLSCPLPALDLEEEIEVCHNESLFLDVELPNSTYLWSDGSTNPRLSITESGKYEVEITNACGSKTFSTQVVFQYPPETIIEINPTSCDSYILIPKNVEEDIIYLWENDIADSVFIAEESGWYSLTASNQCGSKTDSIYVEIQDFSNLVLPNIITPNDDEKNDVFIIDERLQNNAISIYNRYGKLVYQNPRYLNDWDSGNLNSGHYFYQITLECGDVFKGWLEVRK